MADLIVNNMKGKFAHYAGLPGTNDALIVVPLESSGLATDDTIRDTDDLGTLLGGTTNEQTTMGRKTLSNVTVTVDDTNNRVDVDADDITWTAATGNAVGALLVCYDPDTTTGDDSDVLIISKHDFSVTPDGSDITATVAVGGFLRAQEPA